MINTNLYTMVPSINPPTIAYNMLDGEIQF
jgi:hypothetical protein